LSKISPRSIGADRGIAYMQKDFTQNECYDLILDIVANRSVSDYVRAQNPKVNYVAVLRARITVDNNCKT
jgi:hypothetical protein